MLVGYRVRHVMPPLLRLPSKSLVRIQMQCTHALTTEWVTGHVELAPKGHRLVGVEDLGERLLMDIAQRPMKEAGAHGPVCLDDAGDPGRIADCRGKVSLTLQ